MARTGDDKREASKTSITDAAAADLLKSGAIRSRIYCKKISGFHLIRLAKGCSYRYRYTDFEGKRREYTLPVGYPAIQPAEAAKVAIKFIADEIDPLKRREESQKSAIKEKADREERTLKKFLNGDYSENMESWSTSSARENKQRIENHFADLLDKPMDEISKDDVKQWQKRAREKGLKHSTIKRTFASLQALLNKAVEEGTIQANPLKGHKLLAPTIKEQEEQKRAEQLKETEERKLLTPEEVSNLMNGLDLFAEELRQQRRNSRAHGKQHLPDFDAVAYPHWFIPFCLFAFHTGQRSGDIRTMEWGIHLNLETGRYKKETNKSQWVRRMGKEQTVVDVPLNNDLLQIMREWWKQSGKPSTGYVFTNPQTGRLLDKTGYRKAWLRVKELGGLDPDLDFYSLRHNFCSVLVAQGVPLFAVAKMVGHKDSEMISKHYGHLCPQQAETAVNLLSSQVGSAMEVKSA